MENIYIKGVFQRHYDLFWDDLPPYEGVQDDNEWRYGAAREIAERALDLAAEHLSNCSNLTDDERKSLVLGVKTLIV